MVANHNITIYPKKIDSSTKYFPKGEQSALIISLLYYSPRKCKTADLDQQISEAKSIFEAFGFSVASQEAEGWHFDAKSTNGSKSYAVCCVENSESIDGAVEGIAQQVPDGTRLVIISPECTEENIEFADAFGYTLLTLDQLEKLGEKMKQVK